eukprot:3930434-Pleurochrysis_carterae.AAC.1
MAFFNPSPFLQLGIVVAAPVGSPATLPRLLLGCVVTFVSVGEASVSYSAHATRKSFQLQCMKYLKRYITLKCIYRACLHSHTYSYNATKKNLRQANLAQNAGNVFVHFRDEAWLQQT